LQVAPRAAVVKAGRRPPPEAARSGLDGGEHGAMLFWSGGAIGVIATGRIRGELACRLRRWSVPQQPCIRYDPFLGRGPWCSHAHRRRSSEGRAHSTKAAQRPWAEAGHRHLGSSSAASHPKADARRI